ncbi:uncharacterized protein [Choristoneura fumiferana]|uniref:uncharacterized protein n=1 Tax=Choristoneura fumiferana TaxID=7141 RepID=UPI003D159031
MLFFFLAASFNHNFVEGRVYCEDSHAKWDFRGYSCPVNCNNVVYAVERLKLKDVNNLLTPESQTIEDLNNDKVKNVIHSNEGTAPSVRAENTTNLYIICEKVLENNVAVNEVQEELAKFNKSNCRLFVKKKLKSYYMKLRRCRRSYEDEFVSIFTKILNRHAHGKYKFTEELTALILEKLLGKNINLRHGVGDVKKLLHFLKRALLKHKLRSHASSITLRSRHCLTLFVPGCYCLPGFVENGGQCVQPADCFPDALRTEYLPRVNIL